MWIRGGNYLEVGEDRMPASHDFEVKYFLNPDQVLDAEYRPIVGVREAFELADRSRDIAMQFVDGAQHELDNVHWNIRLRRFEGEDELELTYKKRYAVDPAQPSAAEAQATRDGFGPEERDYDAQIEWGSSDKPAGKRTLSLSRRKTLTSAGKGLTPPAEDESRAICLDGLPGKLARLAPEGWARGVISTAQIYGPVVGTRWTGKWITGNLCIEVWHVDRASKPEDRLIVEISFKHDSEAEAAARRAALEAYLVGRKWLHPGDVLKTRLILDSYAAAGSTLAATS